VRQIRPSRHDSKKAESGRRLTRSRTREGLLVSLLSVVGRGPSGGDRLIVELARRWPSQHGAVTVLTTTTGVRYVRSLGIDNLRVEVLSAWGASSSWVALAYLVRTIAAPVAVLGIVRKSPPRLVVSASPFPPDVAAALVAAASGIRWIHSWQLVLPFPAIGLGRSRKGQEPRRVDIGTVIRQALTYASQGLSLLFARWWCVKLMVPTELMALNAVDRGFRRERIHVANYGIDCAEVQASLLLSSSGPSKVSDCIFVGRFHPQKGLDDLIEIWRRVQASQPAARLAVVGDGFGRPAARFKEELSRFSNQTTDLLGVLTGAEKYAAMSKASVFVFPSHHESWGHVVLEAMAVGLPVIGYDLPSSKEVFGDAMIQVPSFDVEGFAQEILRCLSDERLRAVYRARGFATAAKYDWNTIAEKFVESVL
jgi:glycosyltransferase involved in cell wall biosynthesis